VAEHESGALRRAGIPGRPGLLAATLAALGRRDSMAKREPPGGGTLKPERVQVRLSVAEARERVERLPAWRLGGDGRTIERAIGLPSLALTAAVVDLVAALSEMSAITPELELRAGILTLRLGSTREGLFEEHFVFADAVEGAALLGRLA
jgi:hypothetical protein